MIATAKPQAIAGVSVGYENELETVYPSIACRPTGRFLGRIYDCIPLKINGIKLSNLLFVLPSFPLAIGGYVSLKVFGEKYVLTNRAVRSWKVSGKRLVGEAALNDIAEIRIERRPGQAFFRAGDLRILDAGGHTLLRLDGVPYPERFRQIILEARDARQKVALSMSAIEARARV